MLKKISLLTLFLLCSQFTGAFWPFSTYKKKIVVVPPVTVEIHGLGNNVKAYLFWKYITAMNRRFEKKNSFDSMNPFK